jgi:hypothetical protein
VPIEKVPERKNKRILFMADVDCHNCTYLPTTPEPFRSLDSVPEEVL